MREEVIADSVDIRSAYPPNYDSIVQALGKPPRGAVFAYDRVIYAPDGAKAVTFDIIVHEQVHFLQQAHFGGPDAWWALFLSSDIFRCEQEAEAYRAQIACWPSREQRRAALRLHAKQLASPMYRLPINERQAKEIIQNGRLAQMVVPS